MFLKKGDATSPRIKSNWPRRKLNPKYNCIHHLGAPYLTHCWGTLCYKVRDLWDYTEDTTVLSTSLVLICCPQKIKHAPPNSFASHIVTQENSRGTISFFSTWQDQLPFRVGWGIHLEFSSPDTCESPWAPETFYFLNGPRALAHLPTKDSLKTPITSNSKHEMKIDAFSSCNDENGKLPETPCSLIFHVTFQECR